MKFYVKSAARSIGGRESSLAALSGVLQNGLIRRALATAVA